MKKVHFIFTTLFTLVFGLSYAQTAEDDHKKITEHHTTLVTKHDELASGKVKDKKKYTEETKSSLDSAKKHHAMLMTKMSEKDKTATKDDNDAIKKHHASAARHHEAMKAEISKPNGDDVKIKEHSKSMSNEVKEAEKSHLLVITKTKTVK